ncbi:MAG: thiol-disulfide oxidoreductase, partial [Deltaproteobacteria bacterium]|nr:thiol-disulfide oxidoreductase [Deltaproteobacteria bacterium]
MEKRGIPTVTIVTTEFNELSRSIMRTHGLNDMAFVATQHPMGSISIEEIQGRAEQDFPEIFDKATVWEPEGKALSDQDQTVYPSERIFFTGTYKDVNDMFFEKGRALGLPVIPPTTEAVENMLKGTSHKPDEVLWVVPPRMGVLTVELVAVHAAMAGCKPGYLPVILAAIEGMSEPEYNWNGAATTTGTVGPMLLINGPIRNELGIACGQGAAGKGYHPNISIGYAICLIGYVVGGSRPPDMDKSTFGSPGDVVAWVYGENEEASPWDSYAVEHGFDATDSVVTVKNVYPTVDMPDHSSSTPENYLKWWGHVLNPMMHVPLG